MQSLTELQKILCNRLQQGIPVCRRPFARLAQDLGTDENTILHQVAELKKSGIIRRLAASIDHRALGKASTLAAAYISSNILDDVIEAVNALEGVSHNYLRGTMERPEMKYDGSGTRDISSVIHQPPSIDEGIQDRGAIPNLWFTLQGTNQQEIAKTLAGLSDRFGIIIYNLPVVRMFKLDVFFDLQENEEYGAADIKKLSQINAPLVHHPSSIVTVSPDADEQLILSRLQDELELTAEPFSFLCNNELNQQDILTIIQKLIDQGVIRRISAVLDYRNLGYMVNVLFVCRVQPEQIDAAGRRLAACGLISHCYQRKTVDGWPYNLFAMMHSRSLDQIQKFVAQFVEDANPQSYLLLPSISELKKHPVRHKFR
jgi:siroheme decarboxylase